MNERMTELYAKACLDARDIHPTDVEKFVPCMAEKFAELIVKECMSMCDETQANYLKHRKATIDFDEKNIFAEGEAASDVIKYKMKKHFGVE